MSDIREQDFEALQNQCAALESLVIDLLAIMHELAPDQLEERLAERGQKVGLSRPRPLGPAAGRRRRNIAAAGVPSLRDRNPS